MKNMKRFFCFFLCFCLCFAWFGPPIEAHASGTALLGILITFMLGSGIGFAISGTANSLTDGILQLVEEYETNVYDGDMDFWDLLALGSSIGILGEVLLNKAAVDALNGFMNWLQSDKGWSEGSDVSFSASKKQIKASLDSTASSGYVYLNNTSYTSFDGAVTAYHYLPLTLGDVFTMEEANSFYFIGDDVWNWNIFYYNSTHTRINLYRVRNGVNYGSSLNAYKYLEDAGYSLDNVVGYTFSHEGVDEQHGGSVYLFAVIDDGSLIGFPVWLSSLSSNLVSNTNSVVVSIPDQLTSPDTSDWDDVTSLGLFNGHSGNIPSSVEEYNDLIMSGLNSGVIPEVTTDVIVGTPDDTLPDEEDGTLAGTVSGILAQIKALPQTLAKLILDGIKSIFVPDPDEINAQFMELLEEINNKYLFDFDLDSLFGSSKEPDDITAVYSLGDHEWSVTFVSWYYLKKAVEFFRPYIRGFIVLMLIFYNLRQFMAIFGLGGVMNGDSADRRVEDLAV